MHIATAIPASPRMPVIELLQRLLDGGVLLPLLLLLPVAVLVWGVVLGAPVMLLRAGLPEPSDLRGRGLWITLAVPGIAIVAWLLVLVVWPSEVTVFYDEFNGIPSPDVRPASDLRVAAWTAALFGGLLIWGSGVRLHVRAALGAIRGEAISGSQQATAVAFSLLTITAFVLAVLALT